MSEKIKDRREEILWLQPHPTPTSVTINGAKEAMDQYATEMCLELLEYMSKNYIYCSSIGTNKVPTFYFKGQWLTKNQLFKNFL